MQERVNAADKTPCRRSVIVARVEVSGFLRGMRKNKAGVTLKQIKYVRSAAGVCFEDELIKDF